MKRYRVQDGALVESTQGDLVKAADHDARETDLVSQLTAQRERADAVARQLEELKQTASTMQARNADLEAFVDEIKGSCRRLKPDASDERLEKAREHLLQATRALKA